MNPVVHFELPYDDRERIARFYRSAFGWQLEMLGEEMGNYVRPRPGATPSRTRRRAPSTVASSSVIRSGRRSTLRS
jgi:hypothetical protein